MRTMKSYYLKLHLSYMFHTISNIRNNNSVLLNKQLWGKMKRKRLLIALLRSYILTLLTGTLLKPAPEPAKEVVVPVVAESPSLKYFPSNTGSLQLEDSKCLLIAAYANLNLQVCEKNELKGESSMKTLHTYMHTYDKLLFFSF